MTPVPSRPSEIVAATIANGADLNFARRSGGFLTVIHGEKHV